jgi:hypothetical protein
MICVFSVLPWCCAGDLPAVCCQATGWVRKEAEKLVASPEQYRLVVALPVPDVRACFLRDEAAGLSKYETHCADSAVAQAAAGAEAVVASGAAGAGDAARGSAAKEEL